jgi:DNA processing protein
MDFDSARESALRLCLISGVGPRLRVALLERFTTAADIFAASVAELREVPGVGPKLAHAILAAGEVAVQSEISICHERQVQILLAEDPQYPPTLQRIPDPPGVLFVRGSLTPQDELAIAIVGTRHATQYGLTQAERLASGLARAGYTIVSGLARGIDGAAHQAALAAGGRTLAILGSGCLNVYPPEHVALAERIITNGAVISEAPPLSPAVGGMFPQRNRIITGLSLGVIVVEAADSSGALISARHALEQNREVFAVPGRVDSRVSKGCHRLIRDGAKLVESVDDVLEELGPLAKPMKTDDGNEVHHPAELQLNEQERAVLAAIGNDPTAIDQVVVASGLPIARVLATLSVLEMKRLIRRVSGSKVFRL